MAKSPFNTYLALVFNHKKESLVRVRMNQMNHPKNFHLKLDKKRKTIICRLR